MDRRAFRATVHGVTESDMTEHAHTHINKSDEMHVETVLVTLNPGYTWEFPGIHLRNSDSINQRPYISTLALHQNHQAKIFKSTCSSLIRQHLFGEDPRISSFKKLSPWRNPASQRGLGVTGSDAEAIDWHELWHGQSRALKYRQTLQIKLRQEGLTVLYMSNNIFYFLPSSILVIYLNFCVSGTALFCVHFSVSLAVCYWCRATMQVE